MNKIKPSTWKKIGVSLLFALLIVCAVGIAANGWQDEQKEENNARQTEKSPEEGSEDPSDVPPSESAENAEKEPEYFAYLTGLPAEKESSASDYTAFLVKTSAPKYGISSSPLTVEIPMEDGKTRLIVYESNISALGKIGALAASRAYFDTAASFFGGTVVSYGRDDTIGNYSALPATESINLSGTGLCYSEGVQYTYTSGALLGETIAEAPDAIREPKLPFDFCASGNSGTGKVACRSLLLPYAEDQKTSFTYSEGQKQYVLSQNGKETIDLLSGKKCAYRNVFVLFCDTTLYAKAAGKELVPDLLAGGGGYAIAGGALTEIRWQVTETGDLLFSTLDGAKLSVPAGNHYIAFYPAASSCEVTFE